MSRPSNLSGQATSHPAPEDEPWAQLFGLPLRAIPPNRPSAAFFPAEVVGYAVGSNQIANLAWIAIIGLGIYSVLRWDRIAALVIVPLVLFGAIDIVVSAMMQTSVNTKVVMLVVLPGFVIPGILGAALLLHSERE